MKRSLLLFALCVHAFGAQAEVYKWIDADGKTQYGDAPPKNANAKVVSGGVTVVPALVVPPVQSAPKAKSEGESGEGARAGGSGSIGRKPDEKMVEGAAQASSSADPVAAARAEARLTAIERCKSSRGVDCEAEADAMLNAQPAAANPPGYIPGWSQPPIHPAHPPISRSPPHQPAAKPRPPSVKEAAASAPVSDPESRAGGVIKPTR